MSDGTRKLLRVAGRAVVLVSIATQIYLIAKQWWEFDPRLSCHRLPHWDEWLACLHGHSHAYIRDIEAGVVVWLVAAIAMLLGIFLPPYISVAVPGLVVAGFVWTMIEYWHHNVLPLGPFGRPLPEDVVGFAGSTAIFAAFLVGPVVGAWLLAVHSRNEPNTPRVPTAK